MQRTRKYDQRQHGEHRLFAFRRAAGVRMVPSAFKDHGSAPAAKSAIIESLSVTAAVAAAAVAMAVAAAVAAALGSKLRKRSFFF